MIKAVHYSLIRLEMKSDLTWKSIMLKANFKQLSRMKSTPKEARTGLEQRQSMCRFMRLLQKAERGHLDYEIHKSHTESINLSPVNAKKGGRSWNGSIMQSKRASRCLVRPENNKQFPTSPIQRQAQRSLLIKNVHFSCSTSKGKLKKIPLNDIILEETHNEQISKHIQRSQERFFIKSRHISRRHRNLSIQESIKAKLCNDHESSINFRKLQMNFLKKQSLPKGLQSLNNVNVTLDICLPFKQYSNLHKKVRTQQDEIRAMQQCLFKHQSAYLKIKSLEQKANGNGLFHTQNPKTLQQAGSGSFRKYSQSKLV